MSTNPLIIQHGGARVAPGSGFFSCCSVKLYHIVEYFNNNEYLPPIIECDEQFLLYKENTRDDITYSYFKHYDETEDFPYENKVDFHHYHQFKPHMALDYKNLRLFMNKYFSPSVEIEGKIIELQEKYNLDYNNICVLFYRGNDKKTETKLKSYDEVIQHGKNILEKDPNIRFLIQSDEQEFIETCEATLNNYVVFKDEIRTMKKRNSSVDKYNAKNNFHYSKYFLAIVIIMSKCKYFVTGSMGNIPMFVCLYRGNNNEFYF